jgi:DNA-binding response OmpR family regulator
MTQNKKHILVVDDEEKVGFFLSRSLTLMDDTYVVETAHSGEEALDILQDTFIDLLITDLRMPGISGLELIRWVHASSPDTRVVLITAYGNEKTKAKADELDVYRYLPKPFNIQGFTEVVQGALSEGALSTQGVVAFSDDTFEAIAERLETLRYDINARCIYLADMQGQQLTAVGDTMGLDDTLLLTLLAGGFATSAELAHQFGSEKSVNLNFHQDETYDIYSANIDESLFITLVYDRSVQTSRIGMVWLYTRRAIEELSELVASMDLTNTGQALDADFGNSLLNEFDSYFEDEHMFDDAIVDISDDEDEVDASPATAPSDVRSPPGNRPIRPMSSPEPSEEAPDGELFSLEEAVKQGLIPSDLLGE